MTAIAASEDGKAFWLERSASPGLDDPSLDERIRLRDIVVEACNANDPDLLLQLTECVVDAAALADMFDHIDRHSGSIFTPGSLDGTPVSVSWTVDTLGDYRVAGYLESAVVEGQVVCRFRKGHPRTLVAQRPIG